MTRIHLSLLSIGILLLFSHPTDRSIEDTWIEHKRSAYPEFDSFKYIMMQHMKAPVVDDYNKTLVEIANHMEELSQQYALDGAHLTQYGFLNANYSARPTSVMRQCLAYARANDVDVLRPEHVSRVLDQYFDWNLNYVYDIWEDVLSGTRIPLSLRVEYRDVFRVVRANYETGSISIDRLPNRQYPK